MIDFALQFSGKTIDAPTIIIYDVSGYEEVPGAGDAFTKIARNREYFIGNSIVDGLTKDLTTIDQNIKQMEILENIYNFYDFRSDTLHDNLILAEKDYAAIIDQMNQFCANPTRTFVKPSLQSISNGAPSLKTSGLMYSDKWGGGGGSPFNDVDLTCYFTQKTRILSVAIRTGKRVDQLKTKYGYQNPDTQNSQVLTYECRRGGSGGSQQGPINLANDKKNVETISVILGVSGLNLITYTFKFPPEQIFQVVDLVDLPLAPGLRQTMPSCSVFTVAVARRLISWASSMLLSKILIGI